MNRIAIIGAGAAGCFCALLLKRNRPDLEVDLYEAGSKALAKVAITGGGRCNLTNSFAEISNLKEAYPRGEQLIKRAFCQFDNISTMEWWKHEGVRLVTQSDQCVFPQSQDAMQIVHTLLHGLEREGVRLHLRHKVVGIRSNDNPNLNPNPNVNLNPNSCYKIQFADGASVVADKVVVTTGGSPKADGLSFLSPLDLQMVAPVPSLFSFNIQGMSPLMGIVVDSVTVGLAGTKFRADGALLITHWGMSGPAVLKLSSYAARHLAECGYKAQLLVNWLDNTSEDEARQRIDQMQHEQGGKLVGNTHFQELSSRLWQALIERAGIRADQRWSEVGRKQINRLVAVLTADVYAVDGQSRHKDEFVTCGGVALSNLNLNTLEVKKHPGLYLAGEVLDVDAITGGFNLQAAWSMGYVIAMHIASL